MSGLFRSNVCVQSLSLKWTRPSVHCTSDGAVKPLKSEALYVITSYFFFWCGWESTPECTESWLSSCTRKCQTDSTEGLYERNHCDAHNETLSGKNSNASPLNNILKIIKYKEICIGYMLYLLVITSCCCCCYYCRICSLFVFFFAVSQFTTKDKESSKSAHFWKEKMTRSD